MKFEITADAIKYLKEAFEAAAEEPYIRVGVHQVDGKVLTHEMVSIGPEEIDSDNDISFDVEGITVVINKEVAPFFSGIKLNLAYTGEGEVFYFSKA